MLKKQTVWLLTMLSLMIVLSVFYMTSDVEDPAYLDSEQTNAGESATTGSEDNDYDVEDAEVDQITNLGQDELFTMIRMELQDNRSMEKERLSDIVASSRTSTGEKNEAMNELNSIDDLSMKESILQESILATTSEYEDVLVRFAEGKVHVHIKVDDLPKQEVVHIMQMVQDEFGDLAVVVNFQPTEG